MGMPKGSLVCNHLFKRLACKGCYPPKSKYSKIKKVKKGLG